MLKFFKGLDFVSQKPELLFWKKERIKTSYGGLLSLIIVLLALTAAGYFAYDFIGNVSPIVNGSKFYSAYIYREFNRKNLFAMFNIIDGTGKIYTNPETLFSISVIHFNYTYKPDPKNPSKNVSVLTNYNIKTAKCTEDYMKTYYPTLEVPGYQDYFCLEPNFNFTTLNPFGNVGDNAYLNVFFSYCNNKTELEKNTGVVCRPQKEIETLLGSYSAKFAYFDSYLVHDDYNNPFHPYLNTILHQGSNDKYHRLKAFYENIYYRTDVGWLIYQEDLQIGFTHLRDDITIDVRTESQKFVPLTFYQLTIANDPSGFHEQYNRKYRKIQNVMADVGGFTNVLYIIGMVLALIFSQVEYWQVILQNCSAVVDADENTLDTRKLDLTDNPNSVLAMAVEKHKNDILETETTKKLKDDDKSRIINIASTKREILNSEKAEKGGEIISQRSIEMDNLHSNINVLTLKTKDNLASTVGHSDDKLSRDNTHKGSIFQRTKDSIEKLDKLKEITNKLKFIKPTFKNQFCAILCCCEKSHNDHLVKGVNSYHQHVLDVRTIIELHNQVNLIKEILFKKNQIEFFNVISKLKSSRELLTFENSDRYEREIIEQSDDYYSDLQRCLNNLEKDVTDNFTDKLLEKYRAKLSDHTKEVNRRRSTMIRTDLSSR